ncbi:MAG: nuclear transport factor 2 family protein [Nocardia sp.]|uniref:nuclear transport factor 2 family protein n=1 Tax=Nocardia sp. TaxID=1821 RepID=UPI0026201DE1|nr:nuclear transport factor 2 family protein [Nocardia sp.]MCU1644387.1 nuclear transport factor 2 family protein [Nocardia sp.]
MPDLDNTRRIADELEIRNVVAQIAHHSDDGPLELYGSRFTVDALWEMPGAAVRRGRGEILAAAVSRRNAGTTGPGSGTRHVITTVAVQVEGDHAAAESYWLFYGNTDVEPELRSMGKYRDSFLRTADGWRLSRRLITPG